MKTGMTAALALLLCGAAAAATVRGSFVPASTATPGSVPSAISYQGRLDDGGTPVTGTKTMTFSLFDAASAGTQVWTSGPTSVGVSLGLFSTTLSIPVTALVGGGQRYLEVVVDGTTLSPREPFNSVPYALVAKTVEGTIDISTSGLSITTAAATTASLYISSSTGNVGIGTSAPASALHVARDGIRYPDGNVQTAAFVGVSSSVSNAGDAIVASDDNADSSGNVVLRTSGSDRVVVTTDGLVGLGLGAFPPAAQLDIASGGAYPALNLLGNGNNIANLSTAKVTGSSFSCFLAGTRISVPGGTRAIEDLRPGDAVLSYDLERGKVVESRVVRTLVRDVDSFLVINDKIRVTEEHPFYVDGAWRPARTLRPGDRLFDGTGPVRVESARPPDEREDAAGRVGGRVRVYNMEVGEQHNYFAEGVLVHNKGAGAYSSTALTVQAGAKTGGPITVTSWGIVASSGANANSYAGYFQGSVGINEPQPSVSLHVTGDPPQAYFQATPGNMTGFEFLDEFGNGESFLYHDPSTNAMWLGAESAGSQAVFFTNTLEQMRIDAAGNVGIGTPLPAAKLHMSSGTALLDGAGAGIIISNPATGIPTIQFQEDGVNTAALLYRNSGAFINFNQLVLGTMNGAGTVSIRGGNDTEGVGVDASGNVSVKGGGNTVYRCLTAGALPIGALTIDSASCGTSSDTGLRVP